MVEQFNPRSVRFAANQAAPPPVSVETPKPVLDAAATVLYGDPLLSNEDRANVYDVYASSRNSAELARDLQNISLPADTAARIVRIKKLEEPAPSKVDKAVEALNKMAQIDSRVLELSEAHPVVAKSLIDAAVNGGI